MLRSFSVNEIGLTRYVNWSTNFRGFLFHVELALSDLSDKIKQKFIEAVQDAEAKYGIIKIKKKKNLMSLIFEKTPKKQKKKTKTKNNKKTKKIR